MTKLILVSPGFPADENDSAAVPYLQDYCLHLLKKVPAENINIVSTQYPYTPKPYLWNGIQVYPIGGKNRKGIYQLINHIKTKKRLKSIVGKEPAVIHAFWLSDAAMSASSFAAKRKLPCLVTLMGQDAKAGNPYFKLVSKHVAFTSLCNFQANVFRNDYQTVVKAVIPLPLPSIDLRPVISRSIDLLFVGSYIQVKQPLQFIEIVAEIKKKHSGVRAVMIGGGPLLSEINSRVVALHLQDHIVVLESINRDEVFEYMQRSKILVHTSSFEGQCNVYGEALLCGMHVLSYNVGYIADSPKHIVCADKNEFVLKIMQLLLHPINFTPVRSIDDEQCINAYLNLYGIS